MIEQLKEAKQIAEDRWRTYKSQFRKVLQTSKVPVLLPRLPFFVYVSNYNMAKALKKRALGAKAGGLIKTIGDLEKAGKPVPQENRDTLIASILEQANN